MGKAEGAIERHLFNRATDLGFLCWKITPVSETGVPDRVLIGHHQVVFVELKSKTGKTSGRQDLMHKAIRDSGNEVYVTPTKKDVDRLLAMLIKNCPDNHPVRRIPSS